MIENCTLQGTKDFGTSMQARPQPTSADASNAGKEPTLPGLEAAVVHHEHALQNASGRRKTQDASVDMLGLAALKQLPGEIHQTRRDLSTASASEQSAALAVEAHDDGLDAADSPAVVEAPTQHSIDTFAVLCSEVFETRAEIAEAADEGVQHISENPLFMVSRVTDDVPDSAAGFNSVQTPPDLTTSTAAADVPREPEQSHGPHVKSSGETDLSGKRASDTQEMATSSVVTEAASATDGTPSTELSVREDTQAADDIDDIESDHQETLRGRQARGIAKKIRESWAALRQEQQTSTVDRSFEQGMQPALVQGASVLIMMAPSGVPGGPDYDKIVGGYLISHQLFGPRRANFAGFWVLGAGCWVLQTWHCCSQITSCYHFCNGMQTRHHQELRQQTFHNQ